MSLGRRLQRAREDEKLSLDQAGELMGYGRDAVARIEQTANRQPLHKLIQYANLLGTSVSDISHVATQPLDHAQILVIDNNQERWNVYRSALNNHLPQHTLTLRTTVNTAYGCFREDELNLIILAHGKRNKAKDLYDLLQDAHHNKSVAVLLVGQTSLKALQNQSRQHHWLFYDLHRGRDTFMMMIDDLLRFS